MSTPYRQLFRSRSNRMIGGVCAGIGDFFGIDPTIVRLLFVFTAIFGYGIILLVYLALFLVVPEVPQAESNVVPAPASVEPPAVVEITDSE